MKVKYLLLGMVIFLNACASTSDEGVQTDVMRLIEETAAVAPQGVMGNFEFYIQASGKQQDVVYLNTQLDYRDRRNISIELTPALASYIQTAFGEPAESYFLNKKVLVKGLAKQVKIVFVTDGRKTAKYYYQTHVRIYSLEQITILDESV